jgi:hypothetical protein
MTADFPNSPPTDDPEPGSSSAILICALMGTLAQMISGFIAILSNNETPIAATLYLIAVSAPFFLVSTFGTRRFFSAHRPKRLPQNVYLRLVWLSLTIVMASLIYLVNALLARISLGRHDPHFTIPYYAYLLFLGWHLFLMSYTAERKPLSAPRPRRSLRPDLKPIQSEHWGEPAQQ